MKPIKPDFEILDDIDAPKILKKIEKIGRLCYKSEDKITDESCYGFVRGLIARGHEAMLEHASISVLFNVDRGVTHEIVRHRIASFAQESTRYCNYSSGKFGNEITVINPQGAFWNNPEEDDLNKKRMAVWHRAAAKAEENYNELIALKASPQEARTVLINSIKAGIVVTANLREWRHILNLRAIGTTGAPHPQMLEIMLSFLAAFQNCLPVIFDDLKYQPPKK